MELGLKSSDIEYIISSIEGFNEIEIEKNVVKFIKNKAKKYRKE